MRELSLLNQTVCLPESSQQAVLEKSSKDNDCQRQMDTDMGDGAAGSGAAEQALTATKSGLLPSLSVERHIRYFKVT